MARDSLVVPLFPPWPHVFFGDTDAHYAHKDKEQGTKCGLKIVEISWVWMPNIVFIILFFNASKIIKF